MSVQTKLYYTDEQFSKDLVSFDLQKNHPLIINRRIVPLVALVGSTLAILGGLHVIPYIGVIGNWIVCGSGLGLAVLTVPSIIIKSILTLTRTSNEDFKKRLMLKTLLAYRFSMENYEHYMSVPNHLGGMVEHYNSFAHFLKNEDVQPAIPQAFNKEMQKEFLEILHEGARTDRSPEEMYTAHSKGEIIFKSHSVSAPGNNDHVVSTAYWGSMKGIGNRGYRPGGRESGFRIGKIQNPEEISPETFNGKGNARFESQPPLVMKEQRGGSCALTSVKAGVRGVLYFLMKKHGLPDENAKKLSLQVYKLFTSGEVVPDEGRNPKEERIYLPVGARDRAINEALDYYDMHGSDKEEIEMIRSIYTTYYIGRGKGSEKTRKRIENFLSNIEE